eukprot:3463493-Prymnesium_polylepis.1
MAAHDPPSVYPLTVSENNDLRGVKGKKGQGGPRNKGRPTTHVEPLLAQAAPAATGQVGATWVGCPFGVSNLRSPSRPYDGGARRDVRSRMCPSSR